MIFNPDVASVRSIHFCGGFYIRSLMPSSWSWFISTLLSRSKFHQKKIHSFCSFCLRWFSTSWRLLLWRTPISTTGSSGTALFSLLASVNGATIKISKGQRKGCVRVESAVRAVCPTGSSTSTCMDSTSIGNVSFTLTAKQGEHCEMNQNARWSFGRWSLE